LSLLESLHNLRREYTSGKFDVTNALDNPYDQFEKWFNEVLSSDFVEPTAMTLCTVSESNMPSARVVLLKKADPRGYVFFTNYDSKKGTEITYNPKASLLFYWDKLERQVRIEGVIEKISTEESEEYFKSRPYESRLGAWASRQSQQLKTRFSLLRDVAKLMIKYPSDVPLPEFWGGYRLVPVYYEFWQGRASRLHDRIVYHKRNDVWIKSRLYP
jgi:pyridoxamine 5'-phosphate oxidase